MSERSPLHSRGRDVTTQQDGERAEVCLAETGIDRALHQRPVGHELRHRRAYPGASSGCRKASRL